ncbi:DoxX family protein [Haliea sp. E1-2-M8]|uniref:HvfX family Cu-binding RiPP maturation protein n=1 Tax=Haliea sp. E1-2-M8 TaxID=3064706 RepID=UPI00271A9A4F|nr:DoxX family protein [Haliea sp. E1-2-M8]MDO8861340.1 DoxX family protein [Haliea sp. E1-2-M8]
MNRLASLYYSLHDGLFGVLRHLDWLAPLALRLYLVPVFWLAGIQKIRGMENTIEWFGNPDWGLGLPFPALLAHLAAYTEAIGALLLLLGLATRWVALPLLVTMAVAAFAVHWQNGWAAIADSGAEEIAVRLGAAQELLREHGNYTWLTEHGNLVILNNGVEFAATYFIMLLALLYMGGGRFVSADYYLSRLYPRRIFLRPKMLD